MKKYSKQDLLSCLKLLNKKLGHSPTQEDILKYGIATPMTYVNHFGSLRKAYRKAGLKVNKRGVGVYRNSGGNPMIEKSVIIKAMKDKTKKLGRLPHAAEMRSPTVSISTICRAFGTFNKGLRAAGLK